jgi:RNA ligase (TIGR02306 family)
VDQINKFKVNDLCIYCEIDSFLPICNEFEFLRKSSYRKMADGTEGFRLKTIILKNQISQGLLLSTSILNSIIEEGKDVSDELGIVKYEPPIPVELFGISKGNHPSFIPKTDEIRIQNLTNEYSKYQKNNRFYISEKLEGVSSTYYFNNGEFGVCSHNTDFIETEQVEQGEFIIDENGIKRLKKENSFWKVAHKYNLKEKISSLGINIAFQGELIGEGIQGNIYNLRGQTVRMFNVFLIDEYRYMNVYELIEFTSKLGLETVPILDINVTLPESISELIKMADGQSVINPNTRREGLVIRSMDMKISFKVVSNKYLLKSKD